MAKRTKNILDLLSQCPWWVSLVVSGIVYVALRFIVPTIEFKGSFLKGLAGAAPTLAVPLGVTLVIPAPIAFFNSLRKKKLLDKQRDLDSIKCLSWKEFEELIAEAYRRPVQTLENPKSRCPRRSRDVWPDGCRARLGCHRYHVGTIHSGGKDFC